MSFFLPFLFFCQSPPSGDAFLLQGGTVHTISGTVIENGSILVRDGRIVGVGKNLTAPEGVPVINVSGKQIYPGMIDTALPPKPERVAELMSLTRNNGVTSVITVPEDDIAGKVSLMHLDGSPEKAIVLHLRFPAIVTRPLPVREPEDDDEEPTTAVEEKTIPYSEAKKTFNAQMKKLNAFFEEARRYQRAKSSKKQPPPDERLEAMIPVVEGTQPILVTAVREREIRDAIAFAAKQKIKIVLADAYEAYKVTDLIKANNIAVVLGPTLSLPLDRDDPYDRSFTTPQELFKAGIKFSIATFSTHSSRNLPYQAAAAVPYGLPEDEAYKAVSLNAAEILGLSKRLGSIDEGKTADLIVADGDPLEAQTHITQVYIGGKPVEMRTRQKQLADQYDKRP
jgi:imidazolonepropionase-like amidohydrolase